MDCSRLKWLAIAVVLAAGLFLAFSAFDVYERFHQLTRRYESWELDELLLVALASVVSGLVIFALVAREQRRALAKSEQRFRDIAEVAGDWIWEMDSQFHFTYLSDRFEDITGLSKSSFIGRSRWELGADDSDPKWAAHRRRLEAHQPFRAFEYTVLGDGKDEPHHFTTSGKPVVDRSGRFLGYRGTATDITERRRAEQKLKAREALLGAIVENSMMAITLKSPDGRYIFVNPAFDEMLCVGGVVAVGKTAQDLFSSTVAEAVAAHDSAVLESGHAITREEDLPLQCGQRTFIAVKFPIRNSQGEIEAIGSIRADITHRKDYERKLEQTTRAAEVANRSKSEFLANMSHELRTPLNAIIGFAEILERGGGKISDPRHLSYAKDIRESGEHLLAVINDILDVSRIEAGKLELQVEPVDLRELAENALRLVAQRAKVEGIALVDSMPADLPRIAADGQRLRQVLLNLLSNAVKFAPPGSTVTLRAAVEPEVACLEVQDEGIGMAEDQVERAFEPFVQLDSGLNRKHEGSGLGLALCKRYVELHGGRIMLESAPGRGTTARVELPRRQADSLTAA